MTIYERTYRYYIKFENGWYVMRFGSCDIKKRPINMTDLRYDIFSQCTVQYVT